MIVITTAFSLVQGGVITELARSYLEGTQGVGAASSGSFSLRWPPAFFDGHLGSLSFMGLETSYLLSLQNVVRFCFYFHL